MYVYIVGPGRCAGRATSVGRGTARRDTGRDSTVTPC